uniref:McrB family protein n=1 Tax=Lactococcus sp. TaxID=44273 RepID=UPI00324299E1
MGKIVLPKHSSDKSDFVTAIKIYYEKKGWVENQDFVDDLKREIGDGQYPSSYNKKAQLPKYFGFVITENINGRSPRQKITSLGKTLYEALQNNDQLAIDNAFMISMENIQFGRNNLGSPSSDSDIEAPNVAMHAIKDLGYITYLELAFILQNLDDNNLDYNSCITEITNSRLSGNFVFDDTNRYSDNKPIMLLVNLGILTADEVNSHGRVKSITFSTQFRDSYLNDIPDLKMYNKKEKYIVFEETERSFENESDYDFVERLQVGTNTLLYGVPGAGKSFTIEHEYINEGSPRERLVFHPDYTYSDFVGQILPVVTEDNDGNKNVSYEFTPGPFTTLLKEAYYKPKVEHFLVIEEINRGNAPAIFGEIFQLLDRKIKKNSSSFPIGTSEYEISNTDIAKFVYNNPKHKVRIPSNMSIIGTMNTSDQNVFTLDTAFQRRWSMRLIENTFKKDDVELANTKILDTSVTWKKFCETINEIILDKNARMTSSEDKRLGTHFIQISDLQPTVESERYNRLFPEKVIKYLWDDAFKFTREEIFDIVNYNSLEKVIRAFIDAEGDKRFSFFVAGVKNLLVSSSSNDDNVSTEE